MPRFRITYTDPETLRDETVEKEFEDTPGNCVDGDGNAFDIGPITAREWAEDWAYAAADKGRYAITPIADVPIQGPSPR